MYSVVEVSAHRYTLLLVSAASVLPFGRRTSKGPEAGVFFGVHAEPFVCHKVFGDACTAWQPRADVCVRNLLCPKGGRADLRIALLAP